VVSASERLQSPEESSGSDPNSLAILEKASAIIAALSRMGAASAGELASIVAEPVSSTYRLLSSLVSLGWIEPALARGKYRLGVYLVQIGGELEDRVDVRQACQPELRKLRQNTKETTFLCYRRGDSAVCVERIGGRDVQALSMRIGDALPLTHGAAPLAILANLPREERELVLERATFSVGGAGQTVSRAEIDNKILRAREQGHSVSDEDVTPGIAALGAPVFNHRGELVGAVSLSGLRDRVLDPERRMAEAVRQAALASSRALGFRSAADEMAELGGER
jgi:DNA-binding IclR family transcriptional regulator